MKNYILIAFLFLIVNLKAQVVDTIAAPKSDKLSYKHFVVPTILFGSGCLMINATENKNLQANIQNSLGNNFHTKIDDFIQFAPIVQVYGGHLLGFKSINNIKQQTVNLIVANAVTGAVVLSLKNVFKETRPDFSANNSFPSGHTATAFTNATVLFYEYKNSNFLYAGSGYLFATATGFLRIANNRHFTSDVLAGAGIGIAVGFAVSYCSPFQSLLVGKNKKTQAILYPQIGESYGLGILIRK